MENTTAFKMKIGLKYDISQSLVVVWKSYHPIGIEFASVCASIFILSTEHLSDNILEIFETPDNQILLRRVVCGHVQLAKLLPSKRLTPGLWGLLWN